MLRSNEEGSFLLGPPQHLPRRWETVRIYEVDTFGIETVFSFPAHHQPVGRETNKELEQLGQVLSKKKEKKAAREDETKGRHRQGFLEPPEPAEFIGSSSSSSPKHSIPPHPLLSNIQALQTFFLLLLRSFLADQKERYPPRVSRFFFFFFHFFSSTAKDQPIRMCCVDPAASSSSFGTRHQRGMF